jgi:gas vesicle protein
VGMLSAPRSGIATRNYLQTKTREGTDYLKQQVQDLVNGATETIERGEQKVRNEVDSLSGAVDAGKQAYRETVETYNPLRTRGRKLIGCVKNCFSARMAPARGQS